MASLIDRIFNLCVDFLMWLARLTGLSYEEINVIIFCIIWPLITMALIAVIARQRVLIRKLMKTLG